MRFDPTTATPREVEGYLREQVRKIYGDEIENRADIHSSHGYYTVSLKLAKRPYLDFTNFRKSEVPWVVRALKDFGEGFKRSTAKRK